MLSEQINNVRRAIRSGHFINEAAVCQGVVLPLLHSLRWPVFDPLAVAPEYTLGGRRVDYALCHPPGRPLVFIEVKQPGQGEGADRQLFEYAFHEGIPMAVLTDGQEWHFYLPAEQGHYDERRVYKLDILERDPEECEHRLKRYLAYENVRTGAAIESARKDYEGVRRKRQVEATLPAAWKKLVEDEDELLIELLIDQVENLSGYKPEPDAVARFLSSSIVLAGSPPSVRPQQRSVPRSKPTPPSASVPQTGAPAETGFVMAGEFHPASSARDVMIKVFELLAARDETFLERFAALPKHGRSRRYLARDRSHLYPGREDLARDHAHELRPGWWMGTNCSIKQIEKIIRMGCEVASVRFGAELAVRLD